MKSINLVITLCMYLSRMGGMFSHPSSHHSQQGHLGRRQGFPGMLSGLGGSSEKNDNSGGGGCSKYKIISARGTGENQAMPTVCMGLIKGVLSAVPGGGNYEVVYPAAVDYMNGPVQGATDAIRYLSEQHKQCVNQVYVFVGYSEGAMVITQTMNKLPIPPSSVAAVSLYGNPYFKGGAPQNACSAKGGAGVAAAMGVGMPEQFTSRTFDCCITGDTICQTAGSMVSHLAYPGSSSEKEAIEFVSSKLKDALSGSHLDSSGSNEHEDGSTSSGDEDNGNDESYKGKTSEHGSKSVKDENDESTRGSDGQTNEDKTGTGTSTGTGLPSWPGLSSGKKSDGGTGLPSFPGFHGLNGMGNGGMGLPELEVFFKCG